MSPGSWVGRRRDAGIGPGRRLGWIVCGRGVPYNRRWTRRRGRAAEGERCLAPRLRSPDGRAGRRNGFGEARRYVGDGGRSARAGARPGAASMPSFPTRRTASRRRDRSAPEHSAMRPPLPPEPPDRSSRPSPCAPGPFAGRLLVRSRHPRRVPRWVHPTVPGLRGTGSWATAPPGRPGPMTSRRPGRSPAQGKSWKSPLAI